MLSGGAVLCLASAPAHADDLRGALTSAYNTNPTLQAARSAQRATDESVPIAKAAGRPGANATAQLTEIADPTGTGITVISPGVTLEGPSRQLSAGVNLSVPLYSGGAVRNQVRAAERRVEAGQADLRGTESAVFSQTVGAYMDVILQQAVVGLNRKNVEVLSVNLEATRDRFEIGDLTRTDVAQSEARLAVARSDTRTAEANLANARERYIQIVGKPPVELEPPPPLPGLPATPEEAVGVALDNNPDILAAKERSKAADYDIDVASAARLPSLSAVVGGTYSNALGSLHIVGSPIQPAQSSNGLTIGLSGSIPLFQGGRPAAQRRQAQAQAGAALEQEIGTERDVIAQTRSAYQSWRASNDVIISSQAGVDAASLSLEGVRAENSVGNRTILDILNAEQELLNAQVRLVTARRNAYVAGFTLLAAMGRAEARDLGLDGGALYDPELNFNRVKGKWSDWSNDPAPVARATRTVDTPAQDGAISPRDSVPMTSSTPAGTVTGDTK
ncbi:MAG: TolC family outer membrane protein [Novosphingobium sp.]